MEFDTGAQIVIRQMGCRRGLVVEVDGTPEFRVQGHLELLHFLFALVCRCH